jgi:hypothetical protein
MYSREPAGRFTHARLFSEWDARRVSVFVLRANADSIEHLGPSLEVV